MKLTKFYFRTFAIVGIRVNTRIDFNLSPGKTSQPNWKRIRRSKMKSSRLLKVAYCCFVLVKGILSNRDDLYCLRSILDGHSAGHASFIENRNRYLNIQLILQSLLVYDSMQCALNCLATLGCRSFNFGVQTVFDGKHSCELLPSDKFNYYNLFAPTAKYHHYSISNPCEYTPCSKDSTCVPLYETSDFVCHCAPGSIGNLCDIKVPSSLKVNSKEVCFGTRGNSYGSFTMPYYGKISAFKLVHLRGSVSCRAVDNRFSYWRCDVGEFLNTFLTNSTNAVVFPQISGINSYTLPGIWSNSTELTFKNLTVPLSVSKGQEFRVWYGEDLKDESETDNGGRACMDIYALYV